MADSEDKKPIINGIGMETLHRLSSFKTPRDLSLGGAKPNKKVFVPNLNATRNKNKGPSTTNNKDQKVSKQNRERRNDKNKNNNKNLPKVVKSSGVFSEGLGATERHVSRISYGRSNVDSAPTLQKPTIRIKDMIKIDKELEDKKIKAVVGDNHSGNIEEDFKDSIDKEAPVRLPLDIGGSSQKKPKPKIKQEVVVKQELADDVDVATSLIERTAIADLKEEAYEDTDVVNLLKNDQPTLILLQLPDTLPGRSASSDDDGPRKPTSQEPSTSNSEPTEEKTVDNRCYLSDLEEGRIGTLLVHRSGRVTMKLGDTVFEVSSGTKAAFHQEVISVGTEDASRSANLVALGALQHKLNIVPDWETMFRDLPV